MVPFLVAGSLLNFWTLSVYLLPCKDLSKLIMVHLQYVCQIIFKEVLYLCFQVKDTY